jgi:hypothetical protein
MALAVERCVPPLTALETLNDPLKIVGAVHHPQHPFASYDSFIVFIGLSAAIDRDGSRDFALRKV